MSRKSLMISVACVAAFAAAPALAKSTLYQLPLVPGSTETLAFGITNSGTITGFYLNSSAVEGGFVGPADGTNYTTFSDTVDGAGTQPRGINSKGLIMGIANVSTGQAVDYVPFERAVDGTITDVTKKGQVLNYLVQGINKHNIFDGGYIDPNTSADIGYIGKSAKYKSAITLNGITNTGVAGRGINDAGDTVGWYLDSNGAQHGFYQPYGGTAVTIDDPSGVTNPEGINNKGEISGIFTDSSNVRHGFIYEIATNTFTELTIPNESPVEVWGLNDHGQVAIDGFDSSTGYYIGYIYCPSAKNCPGSAAAAKHPVLQRRVRPVPTQTP